MSLQPTDIVRMRLIEAGSGDHFYGAWHGGGRGSGGGPGALPTKAARTADLAKKVGAENVGDISKLKGQGKGEPTGKGKGVKPPESPSKGEAKFSAAKPEAKQDKDPEHSQHQVPPKHGEHPDAEHWGKGKTVSADEAYAALQRGESPNVAPRDVAKVLARAAADKTHGDLTDLQVAGTLKFGGDGLGYKRDQMPQLGSNDLPRYIDHLRGQGVTVTTTRIDPASLKPIQSEVSSSKVGGMLGSMRDGTMRDGNIVITRDGYVLDGHHRWGAATALSFERPNVQVGAVQIGMDAKDLLPHALEWTGSQGIARAGITEAVREAEHLRFQLSLVGRVSPSHPLRQRLAVVQHAIDIAEKGGDEHFYGAWKGGSSRRRWPTHDAQGGREAQQGREAQGRRRGQGRRAGPRRFRVRQDQEPRAGRCRAARPRAGRRVQGREAQGGRDPRPVHGPPARWIGVRP